jgi:hypothetical protein
LVQAVKAPSGKELTKEEWTAVDKSAIQELRLHVVFSNQAGSGSATAGSSVAGVGPSPAAIPLDKSASLDQVRVKYDELVSYSKRLEGELESTKSQLKKKSAIAGSSGFSTLQLVIAMLFAVIVARVATIMGY